jgi:hypothetical protein
VLQCFNFFFKEGEKNFEITHNIYLIFKGVRECFAFLSGLGQTHSLASFGFELGLVGL